MKLAGILDHHHLFHILDHAQGRGIARRVAADGAGVGVGDVVAHMADILCDSADEATKIFFAANLRNT